MPINPTAFRRRLTWANVPATLLVTLLQRTPVLRVLEVAENTVIASPVGNILRSGVATAAALGAVHALAGATTIVASTTSPLSATVGQAITPVAFGINGGQLTASSWALESALPPGLSFQGLTAPGNVNTSNPILSGTPTAAGSYQIVLEAWEDPNETGAEAPLYSLTVNVTGPPAGTPSFTLTASPATITVASGRSVVFNAIATGTPAPSYQWKFNGSTTIPGAAVTNDSILKVAGITPASAGTYSCTATNSVGSATTAATLAVTTTAAVPGYLTNLSGRGVVGSGSANGVFAGFGITGTGSKQLLIRGIGPGLYTQFQLAGYLADPLLTLYNNASVQINQNGPWGGTQVLMNAEAALGAFSVPANSLDAMLYLPIPVGNYSAEISGVGSSTGIALAEVYDGDAAPPPARLNNISIRTPVGTGADILFGGFVIGGSTGETVLIRAIGPSLTTVFNLGGTLAQPVLTLYSGSTVIYSNTVWGGDPVLSAAETTVGAYTIPVSSQDSLLLVTLPPGAYSAQIQGVNNTVGIAAVEIYEVP